MRNMGTHVANHASGGKVGLIVGVDVKARRPARPVGGRVARRGSLDQSRPGRQVHLLRRNLPEEIGRRSGDAKGCQKQTPEAAHQMSGYHGEVSADEQQKCQKSDKKNERKNAGMSFPVT